MESRLDTKKLNIYFEPFCKITYHSMIPGTYDNKKCTSHIALSNSTEQKQN
jgi:hypothetical protein